MASQVEGPAVEPVAEGPGQGQQHPGAEPGGVHQEQVPTGPSEVVEGQVDAVRGGGGADGGRSGFRTGGHGVTVAERARCPATVKMTIT